MNVQPFTPGATVTLSATTSSSSNTVTSGSSVVRLANSGSVTAFFRFGVAANGTVTATTTDCPILAGVTELFSKPIGADTIAIITGSGTATVYATSGEGM